MCVCVYMHIVRMCICKYMYTVHAVHIAHVVHILHMFIFTHASEVCLRKRPRRLVQKWVLLSILAKHSRFASRGRREADPVKSFEYSHQKAQTVATPETYKALRDLETEKLQKWLRRLHKRTQCVKSSWSSAEARSQSLSIFEDSEFDLAFGPYDWWVCGSRG